jgi:hypothetical protein
MSSLVTPIIPSMKGVVGSWRRWINITDPALVNVPNYRMAFTREQYVRYFCGVKDYTISAGISGVYTHDTGIVTDVMNFAFTGLTETFRAGYRRDGINPIFTGYTSENDYVVDGRTKMFITQIAYSFAGGSPNPMATERTLLWDQATGSGSGQSYVFNDGNLWPYFLSVIGFSGTFPNQDGNNRSFNIGLVAGGIYPLNSGQVYGAYTEGGFNSSLLTGSFLGLPMTYFATTASGGGAGTNSFTITSSTFNITSISWWPYDPGDGGGPIWNASDGSQLRNPFH